MFHPKVDAEWSERYANVARFRGKFVTGGSDNHGATKEVETIGTARVPESLLAPILERL